jgi:isochorismate pyruvate lyase
MAESNMTRLKQIRTEIDDIDTQIIQLLAERQLWVEAAGRAKAGKSTDAVRATDRVEQVIKSVRDRASQLNLSPDVAERTFRPMIAAFIDHELDVHAEP